MSLTGYRVGDSNYILRFSVIVFMGILAFGTVLAWRSSLLYAAEYQEMPVTHEQLRIKKENLIKQKQMQDSLQNKINKRYQLDD